MNRRFIIVASALVLLVTALVAYHVLSSRKAGVLKLYGNVDIRSVDLGFRVPGRIAAIPVDEGTKVTEGDVLARLDSKPLTDALNAAQAQLDTTEAELNKLRNGNRPQDIAQAEAQVADRTATVAQAKAEYERRSELVQSGAVSQALFDASKAQYLAAQAQLRAAEQMLSLQRVGARREDIAAAEAQHAVALAQRDKAGTDLRDATILAPDAGTILTRAREPGAIALAGETVFVLTIDRPMRVRAYVAEDDLSRISPGMAVRVTIDGNSKVYHGTIGFISPTAEFTPKTVQTESLRTELVYRLRIIITDPDEGLRQGQPVTVMVPAARSAAAHR
jgi:HlyD family secretion protein